MQLLNASLRQQGKWEKSQFQGKWGIQRGPWAAVHSWIMRQEASGEASCPGSLSGDWLYLVNDWELFLKHFKQEVSYHTCVLEMGIWSGGDRIKSKEKSQKIVEVIVEVMMTTLCHLHLSDERESLGIQRYSGNTEQIKSPGATLHQAFADHISSLLSRASGSHIQLSCGWHMGVISNSAENTRMNRGLLVWKDDIKSIRKWKDKCHWQLREGDITRVWDLVELSDLGNSLGRCRLDLLKPHEKQRQSSLLN